MNLDQDLSPPQLQAVLHDEGPLLVLAGAGSGKTRVITYRIARLIADTGAAPWSILAVTFTNKAAGEMRERVVRLLGPDAAAVWLGTFHATCARLLRRHPEAVGLKPDFTIYDDDDSLALLSRLLREMNVDPNLLAPRDVRSAIDRAKQDGRGPGALPRRGTRDELCAQVFAEYDKRLRLANAADFGDLLVLAVRLLEEHEDVRTDLQRRFRHVLVDEFQDTNRIQFRLVQLLVNERRNVCVVGDDDQSIYRWRGAEVRNILDFAKHYPGTVTVRLEQNYRSTAHILGSAAAVVKRNEDRHPKELWTANAAGEPVRVVLAGDEREEAAAVVRLVETQRAAGMPLASQAIFYRTNAQSRVLEEALRGRGIPYVVVGGFRFFERAEVKDLLAYLRLLVNPADEASFLRAVAMPPRGVGKVSLERLAEHARSLGRPLLEVAAGAGDVPGLPGPGARALTAFAGQLATWRETLVEGPLAVARRVFEESGYQKLLEDNHAPDGETRLQNVRELIGSIGDWAREHEAPTLSGYLEHVTLQTAVDDLDGKAADRLPLMTVHSAKGLEFDAVYVVGVEEGLMPYRHRDAEGDHHEHRAQMEEERRLAYVAMTRARKLLWLFHARQRQLFGAQQILPPSRFIKDLPPEAIETAELPGAALGSRLSAFGAEGRRPAFGSRRSAIGSEHRTPVKVTDHRGRRGADDEQLSPSLEQEICQSVAEDAGLNLRIGSKVRHVRFGVGRIVDIEPGAEVKISVEFPGWGRKKLVARFVEPA